MGHIRYFVISESMKRNQTLVWLPTIVLIMLCMGIIFLFYYAKEELVRISGDSCFQSVDPIKPNIVIFGDMKVPCEPLDAGQIAGIFSSLAALATLLILVCTLAWQSLQMKQTTDLFLTQLEWEKSKLVADSIQKLTQIVGVYKQSPPSNLISDSQINLESFAEVVKFTGQLINASSSDFDFTQNVHLQFESDKNEMQKILLLLSDLLSEKNVLRYSRVDHEDQASISEIVKNL